MQYTVQPGDTIAKVSATLGSSWEQLKAANPKAVGRSRSTGNWFFKAGSTVSTKAGGFASTLAAAESATKTAAQTSTAAGTRHVVQAGETVWELATKTYGVRPEALLRSNNIKDPRTLQIGQTLIIPAADKAAAAVTSSGTSSTDLAMAENLVQEVTAATSHQEPASGGKEDTAEETVVASWYGQYHHGRPMANGKPFNMHAATIAHKDIPLGTRVLLENPQTGEKATATVTDRGPYITGRDVDLSYGLAKKLSLEKQGVGSLVMTVL